MKLKDVTDLPEKKPDDFWNVKDAEYNKTIEEIANIDLPLARVVKR